MDIKTTPLKNTTESVQIADTTTRTPAKISDEGKSFVDEMASVPNMEVSKLEPEIKQDMKLSYENTDVNNKTKDFEFITTTNDFNAPIINENFKSNNIEILHKNAQQELADEIVLMNKQETKSDKKAEKNFVSEINTKQNNELQDTLISENNIYLKDENIVPNNIQNVNNRVEETKEHNFLNKNQNINNRVEETKEHIVSEKISTADNKVAEKDLNQVKENELNLKSNKSVLDKSDKESKLNNSEFNKSNIDSKDVISDKFVTNETKYSTIEKGVKSENKETSSLTKISEKISKKQDLEHITNKKTDAQTEEVVTVKNQEKFESLTDKIKPELADISNKTVQNTEKTTDKKLKNIMPEKNINKKPTEIVNNIKNIDNEKNITNKDIEITAIADKPVKTEEMKVIIFEPISSPIAELDKSLNTNKTSDIVKFLDANLSSDKTSKTNKGSSASQSTQKSSEKAIKMTESDAKFFNNLIEANQQVIEGTKTADKSANIKELEETQSVQVSKTLLNALKESQDNNKSFRVDFDKDLSVILRVNKDGKISAEFLPGDKAVEQYLKANLPLLQQQFKDEGLEYENLSYRQHKKDDEDKQKQNNKNNKKENGYE